MTTLAPERRSISKPEATSPGRKMSTRKSLSKASGTNATASEEQQDAAMGSGDLDAEEVFFGQQPPGSLKIPFGDQEDPDEMAGAYWFSEVSLEQAKQSKGTSETKATESQFRLVGSWMRHGIHAERKAMRDVVALGPILPISSLQFLDLSFAEEMTRPSTAEREKQRRQSAKELDLTPELIARDPFFVRIGDRLIDVDASLRHVYKEKSDHTGQVHRKDFVHLLLALDLELDEDELKEALLPFPDEHISFIAFREWWMG